MCYHSGPEWTWEQWQWRVTPHSPKLQHSWNLTIRLFSVISRTYVCGGLTALQRSSRCILQPQPTGQLKHWMCIYLYKDLCIVTRTKPEKKKLTQFWDKRCPFWLGRAKDILKVQVDQMISTQLLCRKWYSLSKSRTNVFFYYTLKKKKKIIVI